MADAPNAKNSENSKPPKRNWEAKPHSKPHWVEVGTLIVLIIVGVFQIFIYFKQAHIMQTQADIASKQNEITIQSSRAIVYAKDLRIEKKEVSIPNDPDQFQALWWFSPIVENGGNTTTKNMRVSAQAAFDPSRPGIEVKSPLNVELGPKQYIIAEHFSDVGPGDPEKLLIQDEGLERRGKPSKLIRTILGPHVSEPISGFGLYIDEAKQRLKDGSRLFILGAIHYDDRFSNSAVRLTKYCYAVGFQLTSSGDINPVITPCPHWNCADEECESDKASYGRETADWQAPPLTPPPPYSFTPPFPNGPRPPVMSYPAFPPDK